MTVDEHGDASSARRPVQANRGSQGAARRSTICTSPSFVGRLRLSFTISWLVGHAHTEKRTVLTQVCGPCSVERGELIYGRDAGATDSSAPAGRIALLQTVMQR